MEALYSEGYDPVGLRLNSPLWPGLSKIEMVPPIGPVKKDYQEMFWKVTTAGMLFLACKKYGAGTIPLTFWLLFSWPGVILHLTEILKMKLNLGFHVSPCLTWV